MEFYVLDFSGAYDEETFYLKEGRKISFQDIEGTDCYCDEAAQREILRRLAEAKIHLKGLRFIDSGNYHYLSWFFVRQIQKPFSLVLLDHHPDTQEPGLMSLLSCGSWVRWSLMQLPVLKKVYIIGMNPELSKELPRVFQEKIVTIYKEEKFPAARLREKMEEERLPVYISLDKDVLEPSAAAVNWDQGSMTRETLYAILKNIKEQGVEILGMDVCGEHYASLSNPFRGKEAALNDRFNKEILGWIKNMEIF